MRFLGVTDPARASAFYRDILGFDIRKDDGAIEAVNGPARIQFGTADYGPSDWHNPRPPGSSILFFETSGVSAMHAAISARGGHPSETKK
jgi:catechol 2,3-dioxygenase-like lactoylglutathione lyase family enzyme